MELILSRCHGYIASTLRRRNFCSEAVASFRLRDCIRRWQNWPFALQQNIVLCCAHTWHTFVNVQLVITNNVSILPMRPICNMKI